VCNGLHDALEGVLGVAEQARWIVEWFERICRIGDPAHRIARVYVGAHAADNEIVKAPGFDGNILELIAEYSHADFLHREAVADMGNDADTGPILDCGIRFRWGRFVRLGLGGRRLGRGTWRRGLRQSRVSHRERQQQGGAADHVSSSGAARACHRIASQSSSNFTD
jgi:hypothetical protein